LSFTLVLLLPPVSTPFPYTTLFRSAAGPIGRLRYRGLVVGPFELGAVHRVDLVGIGPELAGEFARDVLAAELLKDLLVELLAVLDRKSTRLNSSHVKISYAVFCLKK